MSEITVSVIVPTRNRPEALRQCLLALAAQDMPLNKFEVLVCDDGSDEDVRSVAEQAQQTGLRIRYLRQTPRGPATARNLGIRHAQAEIVAMTDSDTLPDRAWLRNLVEALNTHPEAVGVEGKVYAENDGEFGPLGEGPTNLTGGVFLTCNCAYRREALFQAGGFDESFPYPAYEDTDLAARTGQLGKILWQPNAVVLHPQRPLTLRAVWKKLHHWEYILLMGYRYGYLGWRHYPVKHPRLRVAALATIALPLAKFKTAWQWRGRSPKTALTLAAFGVVEAFGALVLVAPKALFGRHRDKAIRRMYLKHVQS
ncbi:MAG TPA: glycosyltransferase [Blastocatellia bacterium]|jgi:glycosyltransferase involved in cell wall biosynthesis